MFRFSFVDKMTWYTENEEKGPQQSKYPKSVENFSRARGTFSFIFHSTLCIMDADADAGRLCCVSV